MNFKIAIAGSPGSNKTLLALVLSKLTDIPYIRGKARYEWYRLCGVPNFEKLKLKDMTMISSLSFFERVAGESYSDRFISDGASFSEFMWLKPQIMESHQYKTQGNIRNMIENLEMAIASYAARQYTVVIHPVVGANDIIDGYYSQLYSKYGIPFKVYCIESMEKSIREIVNDLGTPVHHSIESAMCQGKINLFKK